MARGVTGRTRTVPSFDRGIVSLRNLAQGIGQAPAAGDSIQSVPDLDDPLADAPYARGMSHSRWLRTSLRTLHLIAFGAFYGGHVFHVDDQALIPALVAVVGTGIAFLLFEVWRAPVFLVQVRGLVTYSKVALLFASYGFPDHQVAILTVIAIMGSLVSHAPASSRYYALFRGEVIDSGKG